ncbi:MAG: hypothetical protein ABIH90_00260 [Candidatus Aenigmatarchaeota archaeon]
MVRGFVVLFGALMTACAVMGFSSAEPTMQVWLGINDTTNDVYIPGTGSMAAGNLGSQEYTAPGHFWLSSCLSQTLYALVWAYGSPQSLYVENTTSNHTLMINQSIVGSRVLLVFSRGDYNTVDKQIRGIETNLFFLNSLPSFGYGLGATNAIGMLIELGKIHSAGTQVFGKGMHTLNISNQGLGEDGFVSLNITRVQP